MIIQHENKEYPYEVEVCSVADRSLRGEWARIHIAISDVNLYANSCEEYYQDTITKNYWFKHEKDAILFNGRWGKHAV